MNETELRELIRQLEERVERLEQNSVQIGDMIRTESPMYGNCWEVKKVHIANREKGTE